jgi:hypothetical protein
MAVNSWLEDMSPTKATDYSGKRATSRENFPVFKEDLSLGIEFEMINQNAESFILNPRFKRFFYAAGRETDEFVGGF